MFYFHDPLMNTVPPSFTPPAITRVVEVPLTGCKPTVTPVPPLAPPKGWQRAKSKAGGVWVEGTAVAPGAVAGGDKAMGKKEGAPAPSSSPSAQTPLPSGPCAVSIRPAAARTWQPPKGYVEWTTPCECRQTVTIQPHVVAAQPPLAPAPTWSIVSWKHLAPRRLTGTKEEVIALVENDLAAAGIHHLDMQVYDAIHVIVALKR